MCGLSGIFEFSESGSVSRETLEKMNTEIRHRGPDGEGIFLNKNIGLTHRRLSIIDLSTGDQPIFNEDKQVCIVFNGEIYNYKYIKETLVGKGHVFRTNSDTEAILHAYEEYGEEGCLELLRGMFTFAIWDNHKKRLFVARDRIGIKPLYYYASNESLVFGSEIKSVIASGKVKPEIEEAEISSFFLLGYVAGEKTMFKNIYRLLPGHYIVCQGGNIRIKEYWDFYNIEPVERSEEEVLKELEPIFEDVVKMRLMSDVPLGVFLSGGLDSSAVVQSIRQAAPDSPINTFSIGYKDHPEISELPYARKVSEKFGTKHCEFDLQPGNFFEIFPKFVWHLEEPTCEPAAIALYFISKLAKEHATVLLSGEGADELFAGYPIYKKMLFINKYRQIPQTFRRCLEPLLALLPDTDKKRKYMGWISKDLSSRYWGVSASMTANALEGLFSPDLIEHNSYQRLSKYISSYYRPNKDPLSQMSYIDIKEWLPHDLLVKADKMSMAASIELRVPFLDHKLLEFSASVPSSLKIKNKESKYILKKFMEKKLPNEIIYRKKKGFPVPVQSWFKGDFNKNAKEVLLNGATIKKGFFNKGFVENMLKRHEENKENCSSLLFSILLFEMWNKVFIDNSI